MDTAGIVTIVVAIIGLIGAVIREIVVSSKQGHTITDIKSDTGDMKPMVDHIEKNTEKIKDEVAEKLVPNIATISQIQSQISDIHSDMEYKNRLKSETSEILGNKDYFLGGVENLFEENSRLQAENKLLRHTVECERQKTASMQQTIERLEMKNK